jgi:hypothetical protein
MKKLVDETTDDLARSLLIAGIEHRPPTGNKAQLLSRSALAVPWVCSAPRLSVGSGPALAR